MPTTPILQSTSQGQGSSLEQLKTFGLWEPGIPLRLHLGCGETRFEGYLNLDYPPDSHNVMTVQADAYAEIMTLEFPSQSVDEVRLHHVFEHFSRVTALAMLIRWHEWLKIGGKLHIVTPDISGCAKNIVTSRDFLVKMGNVRHLAGDQAASWAYHVDHWFPERFERTLAHFGFDPVRTAAEAWDQPPFLWNVEAIGCKKLHLPREELLRRADELLWESTVNQHERPTYNVWCRQLRDVLRGTGYPKPANTTSQNADTVLAEARAANPKAALNIETVLDFNQRGRDTWVREKATSLPGGARVLDVGAGTCPYRGLFSHCDYKTHDFKQYEGVKLGGTHDYGQIDYVSDVASIPVENDSFDAILCTEVLEHVPEPISALKEMSRILKPGGRLFITAPLGSGLHQVPFHFYGGYTPYWYRKFCAQFGLEIVQLKANQGFFAHLSQMCARAAGMIAEQPGLTAENSKALLDYFGTVLPSFFFSLDESMYLEDFTVGFFVEAQKAKPLGDVNALTEQALDLVDKKDFRGARAIAERAFGLAPTHEGLRRLLEELKRLS